MADNTEDMTNATGGRKRTAWMTHVKATMKSNKGKSLMQVLKLAKKTYKKVKKGGSLLTPAAFGGSEGTIEGGRRRKRGGKTRRNRKH